MEILNNADTITELMNIENFHSTAQKILNDELERNKGLAFIQFDVKDFRHINYLFGFEESYKLLVHIGKIISETFPELCASRFLNDKFIVLAYNSKLEDKIKIVADSTAAFNDTRKIILKAGVYIVPEDGDETSLHAKECAEIACESIKDVGNIYMAFYGSEIEIPTTSENKNLSAPKFENDGADAIFIHADDKNAILKFLYTLYNRIDLIRPDSNEILNIYATSPHYIAHIVNDSAKLSVKNFARKNIHFEDRELFENFFNSETVEERIKQTGKDYITDYFRTRDEQNKFVWQVYLLIPILHKGEKYFLCCSRSIDSEKLKRLPEIDRRGTEYYAMPGNPIFLMLASRSFASVLGYGSFEKFLYNSFYLEVNLTADKILYLHFGKPGMVRTKLNYTLMDYSKIARDIVLNTVVDESQTEMAKFFNRQRLLKEFYEGKFFSESEFLRRAVGNEKPRWLHISYQVRESTETDEINAFFLIFDIDAYRRTNEAMLSLIERDTLTGLYNRRTAFNLIDKALADKSIFAFIILDLDNFKQINDRFGHDCGDKIIRNAARKMNEYFSDAGLVARLGGDEFLVILKNLSPTEIDVRLKNFSEISKSIRYKNVQINYTMSIGYSLYPEQGRNYHELYQNADMALYSVKMSGRNSYKKFSIKMITDNREHLGVSLSQISEGMPGGFLLYRDNENFEIIYANTRLWKIYECNSLEEFRDFTGNSFQGCVHPDDWEKVQKTIYEQVEVSEGYDYVRYRVNTAKGNVKFIEDFGRLVHSSKDGDVFYVFIIDFVAKEKLWDFVTSIDFHDD